MSKILWNALGIGSGILSNILVLASTLASGVPATEMNSETNTLERVTSVSQLSDINPTDWAFQALQSLIERYGCIVGYPDGTYRGDRALTRYEFAAGLESCLDRINQLIAAGTADLVNKEDLATVQRLQSEFAAELSTLRGRIDNVERQTSNLEAQQFSTTTTLKGEAIFAIIGVSGGDKADDSGDRVNDNIIFGNRLRLTLNTSFTGKDRLVTRLQARNTARFDDATGTSMARLGFEGSSGNRFDLDTLQYLFPVGQQAIIYINAQASSDDFADTVNPVLDSGDRGAISRFGRRNPIYRQIGSTGIGLDYHFGKAVTLGLGYLADNAADPEFGIFNAPYGAIAQLIVQPSKAVDLGLTYVRSYNTLDTGTGSELANDPFDREANQITANSFGVEANFRVSSGFALGGWVGYTKARAEDLPNKPEADIFNYAITLAFPALGKEGNLAGIVLGQAENDWGTKFTDSDTSFHLEFFYRIQATDNISITPGVLIITNPEQQ
jgi:hypothetical protein